MTADEWRTGLLEIDSDRVEAIVQCGTDLNKARLADEADRWLGKPVIAIIGAIWGMALRGNDISDTLVEFGGLLRDF